MSPNEDLPEDTIEMVREIRRRLSARFKDVRSAGKHLMEYEKTLVGKRFIMPPGENERRQRKR